MEKQTTYTLDLKGSSEVDFALTDALLARFEQTEVHDLQATAHVTMRRAGGEMLVTAHVAGEASAPCDRCLGDARLPVEANEELEVRFSAEAEPYDGQTLTVTPAEREVDLAQFLYECVMLGLPMQRIHKEGECDPEMLKRFKTE